MTLCSCFSSLVVLVVKTTKYNFTKGHHISTECIVRK